MHLAPAGRAKNISNVTGSYNSRYIATVTMVDPVVCIDVTRQRN